MAILKKSTSFIIAVILTITAILPSMSINASLEQMTYLSLGDGITNGEGLNDPITECYPVYVSQKLSYKLYNHAVNGMTTDKMILAIRSGAYDKALHECDIITVSIGFNDIFEILEELINNSPDEIGTLLIENQALIEACDRASKRISSISALLSQKAPHARVYFFKLYNPFIGFNFDSYDLEALTEPYIKLMNTVIEQNSGTYFTFDMKALFADSSLLNMKYDDSGIAECTVSPYPNAKGHQRIAEKLLEEFNIKIVSDIDEHWGKNYIRQMLHFGLYDDIVANDKFNPDKPMTRADLIALIGRLYRVKTQNYYGKVFKDVTDDKFYFPYVTWAWRYKVVVGTNGLFNPDAPVTREETAVIIQRSLEGYNVPYTVNAAKKITYADKDSISDWAYDACVLMQQLNIMKGNHNNEFNPLASVTNAEFATILYNLNEQFNIYNLYS